MKSAMAFAMAFAMVCLVAIAAPGRAQEPVPLIVTPPTTLLPARGLQLPDKPLPTVRLRIDYPNHRHVWVNAPVPHCTADRDYWSMNLAGTALAAADVGLGFTHPAREINPLVTHKPELAVTAAADVAIWYLSRRYKRQDDALAADLGLRDVKRPKVKWWWFPLAPIAGHGAALLLH